MSTGLMLGTKLLRTEDEGRKRKKEKRPAPGTPDHVMEDGQDDGDKKKRMQTLRTIEQEDNNIR